MFFLSDRDVTEQYKQINFNDKGARSQTYDDGLETDNYKLKIRHTKHHYVSCYS